MARNHNKPPKSSKRPIEDPPKAVPVVEESETKNEVITANTSPVESTPLSPSEMTLPEKKQQLRTAVEGLMSVEKLLQKTGISEGVEKKNLETAESAYLEAYKEDHKSKSFLGKLFKRGPSEELLELESTYNNARLEYARKLDAEKQRALYDLPASEKFTKRWTDAYPALLQEGKIPLDFDGTVITVEQFVHYKNQDRMEALGKSVRFREVIKPAAEKKITAREEVLNEKGRSTIEKALGYIGSADRKLKEKYGNTGSRAIKILVATGVISAGSAIAGTVAVSALLGFAGVKIARSVAGAVVGTGTGKLTGALFEKRAKGKQESAREDLKTGGKNLSVYNEDWFKEHIKEIDSEREKNITLSKDETVARTKLIATALGAFIGGAGTTALYAAAESLLSTPAIGNTAEAMQTWNVASAKTDISNDFPQAELPHQGVTDMGHLHGNADHTASVKEAGIENHVVKTPKHAPFGHAVHHAKGTHITHADTVQKHAAATEAAAPKIAEDSIVTPKPHTPMVADINYSDMPKTAGGGVELAPNIELTPSLSELHHTGGLLDQQPTVPVAPAASITPPEAPLAVPHAPLEQVQAAEAVPAQPSEPVNLFEANRTSWNPDTATAQDTLVSDANTLDHIDNQIHQIHISNDHADIEHIQTQLSNEVSVDTHVEPVSINHNQVSVPTEKPPVEITPPHSSSPLSSHAYEPEVNHSETTTVNTETPIIPAEIIQNPFGVKVNTGETHLYSVIDPKTKTESLIVYGGNKSGGSVFAKLQEIAKNHPNKVIYFQSPELTYANGSYQNWISQGTYNPNTRVFSPEVSPSPDNPLVVIGAVINPNTFTKIIE